MEAQITALGKLVERERAKNRILIQALNDIKNLDEYLENEWGDPSERAIEALQKIREFDKESEKPV